MLKKINKRISKVEKTTDVPKELKTIATTTNQKNKYEIMKYYKNL